MFRKLMLSVVLLLFSISAVQIAAANTWNEPDLVDAIILGIHSSKVYVNGEQGGIDEEKTISDKTMAELERGLKPSVVFTGGLELLHVYADGTSMKQDLGYNDMIKMRGLISVADAEDGHFYMVDKNVYTDYVLIKKTSADGSITKTTKIEEHEGLHFILAKDDYMYFQSGDQIVRIKSDDTSIRQNMGPGSLMKENTVILNDEVLFTDTNADYAIYKLHQGKKTKISSDNSFIQYVQDNWIYYTYYDNNRWALYRVTKDGGNKTKLSADADVNHSFLSNNRIYYLDNRTKTLRIMNLDGSNQQVICSLNHSGVKIFAVDGNDVYFTEEDQTGIWTQTLFKANITNGTKQQLVSAPLEFDRVWRRISNINILGEFVTYSIHNDVFIVKKDGSGWKKLDSLRTGYMGDILHVTSR